MSPNKKKKKKVYKDIKIINIYFYSKYFFFFEKVSFDNNSNYNMIKLYE